MSEILTFYTEPLAKTWSDAAREAAAAARQHGFVQSSEPLKLHGLGSEYRQFTNADGHSITMDDKGGWTHSTPTGTSSVSGVGAAALHQHLSEPLAKIWSDAAREAAAEARAHGYAVRKSSMMSSGPAIAQHPSGLTVAIQKDGSWAHHEITGSVLGSGKGASSLAAYLSARTGNKAIVTESLPLTFYSPEEIAAWELLHKAAKPKPKTSAAAPPTDASTAADDAQDADDAGELGAAKSAAQQQADDMQPDDAVDHIANNPPPWLPAAQVPAWQAVVRSGAHTDYHSAANHMHNLVNKFLTNLKPKKKTTVDLMSTGKAGSAQPTPAGPANQGTN